MEVNNEAFTDIAKKPPLCYAFSVNSERPSISTPIITIRGVKKSYPSPRKFPWLKSPPSVTALQSFDTDIFAGEIHGLIGPNGAGKTTLLKIIWRIIQPDAGTIDYHRLTEQQITLITGDERGFYYRLNGWANLIFFNRLCGVSPKKTTYEATPLVERLKLGSVLNRRYQTYSSGERQKIAILRGLLRKPGLMMIDELAKGLDPQATKEVCSILQELAGEGMGILLATHRLDLAQRLCTRITLMHRGRNIASGSPQALFKKVFPQKRYRLVAVGDGASAKKILAEYAPEGITAEGGRVSGEISGLTDEQLATLSLTLSKRDISIVELSPLDEDLEMVYDRLLQNKEDRGR